MESKTYNQTGEILYKDTLANGLRVYYLPKPEFNRTFGLFTTDFGSLDTTFIPLDVKNEEMQTFPEGIAHFLEHKLFEKEHGDVMYDFGALGAQTNAFTSFNKTSYLFSTRENSYECTKLLLDFVQEPYFTKENVEKEQGIIEQEIQMYQDDSDWRLFFGLLQNMYPNSPLADDIAGTPRTINKITAEDLYTNYQTFYHPSNMNLFLTGSFDVEKMAAFVAENQAGKSFAKVEEIKRSNFAASEPKTSKKIQLEVAMPKLALGFRGEDKLPTDGLLVTEYRMSLQLLLAMLFGRTGSRYEQLYNEELIDDSFAFEFELTDRFHFAVITVDSIYPIKLTKLLSDALKNYRIDSDFNEEHLRLIKKELLGDYYKSLNSLEYIANQFASSQHDDINFFDLPTILENLTLEKISKNAEKFISEMLVVDFTVQPK